MFSAAISKLPVFHSLTRHWSWLQHYSSIMISSGPLFTSLILKDYLLQSPLLPSPTVQINDPDEFAPYISDLQTSSWHQTDARVALWLENRPWAWLALGSMATVVVIYLTNKLLVIAGRAVFRWVSSIDYSSKPVELA